MRTGKNRKFARDEDAQQSSKDLAERGKGLYGGDIERVPGLRKGITPKLEWEPSIPIEIRRFPDTEEEQAEGQAYLAHRPLEVEVGFGGGNFLVSKAKQHPETHFVGFEIKRGLCAGAAHQIETQKINNLRIIYEDVRQSMDALFADHSIRRCSVFFPDPWWKKKHVKRRVLTPFFLDLMEQKLEPNGILHIKTDVMPYAEAVEELFASDPRYRLDDGTYAHYFEDDQPTEREAFCLKKDIPFADFRFVLVSK